MAGVSKASRTRRRNLGLGNSKARKIKRALEDQQSQAKKLKTDEQFDKTRNTLNVEITAKTISTQTDLDVMLTAMSNPFTLSSNGNLPTNPNASVTGKRSIMPISTNSLIQRGITKDFGTQVTPVTRRNVHLRQTNENNSEGRRIVSLSSLNLAMKNATFHTSMCGKGPVSFKTETKAGMDTNLIYTCGCGRKFYVHSTSNTGRSINDDLVLGNTQSAIGYKASVQLLSTLEIPTASYTLYKKVQDNVHDRLSDALVHEMRKWAQVEHDLAMAAGEYVIIDGIKYAGITVVVDGGWVKRAYRHSFSSNCGIAVIIGLRTKKVIYADTRISTCAMCDRKREGNTVPKHTCYKNWQIAPNGMESDIIHQGFLNSMKDYNLVYWKFIGDGDSAVYSKVQDVYKEIQVQKVECCNHVLKNFTARLMEISMDKVKGMTIPLEQRRIFNPRVSRLRTGLTQAITYNNKVNSNWKELYNDIINIPYHVFGQHDNCKKYFCSGPKEKELNLVPSLSKTEMWKALQIALDRPSSLADSLVKKESSNYAESFMSVASKFVEGKRKNFGQRNLYRLRMAGAIFSYNECSFWVTEVHKLMCAEKPSSFWEQQTVISERERKRQKKYRLRRPLKIPQLGPANLEYGCNPQKPDLPADILHLKILEKRNSLQLSSEQIEKIEILTRDQSTSEDWKRERIGRITASIAGAIYKLKETTDNTNTLNKCFGRNSYSGTIKAMEYGKKTEPTAVMKYEEIKGLPPGTVKKAGLVVCEKMGILGASPDGFIGSEGLLEVKCPYSLYMNDVDKKGASAWPTISRSSSIFNCKGKLKLKKKHDHYIQCIMQIYVTGRQWCDYMVYSENGCFVERITRTAATDKLWQKIVAKLETFWINDLAPELVDSRFDRGYTEYKCPISRQADRAKKAASRKK